MHPGVRVLVVDDDAGIRQMLRLALHEAGYDVALSDGRGLVDFAGADVAVIDFRLGRRTAVELLAAQPELGALPIVLVTATAARGHVLAGLPDHAELLLKPFDLDRLDTAIRQALERHGSQLPLPDRRDRA